MFPKGNEPQKTVPSGEAVNGSKDIRISTLTFFGLIMMLRILGLGDKGMNEAVNMR